MRTGIAAQTRQTPTATTPTHSNGPEGPQGLPQTPGHPCRCRDLDVGHMGVQRVMGAEGFPGLCHGALAMQGPL